nr:uncharacterized protein LOC109742540 [Aegilops tauschii subsp. strangulata]
MELPCPAPAPATRLPTTPATPPRRRLAGSPASHAHPNEAAAVGSTGGQRQGLETVAGLVFSLPDLAAGEAIAAVGRLRVDDNHLQVSAAPPDTGLRRRRPRRRRPCPGICCSLAAGVGLHFDDFRGDDDHPRHLRSPTWSRTRAALLPLGCLEINTVLLVSALLDMHTSLPGRNEF